MRELTYLVAATLDGYIADPEGGFTDFDASGPVLDFLAERYPETLPTPARIHLGIDVPNERFDTVLMGRSTYEVGANQGLTSPYAHLEQVVFSTTTESVDPAVRVEHDDPAAVVRSMRAQAGRGIWLCGGGILAGALVDEIDTLVVKRQPILLGDGRPMVTGNFSPNRFELTDRTKVGTISVETHHRIRPA